MNSKRIIFWFLLFFPVSTVAFAQQVTKADIDTLTTKVSNLETTVNNIDKRLIRLETKVEEMDKRLTTLIVESDKRLTKQIDDLDKRLTNKIEEMDRRITARIDLLFWAIGALIGVVLAVIALPQLLGYLQGRREREDMQTKIEQQQADTMLAAGALAVQLDRVLWRGGWE
ncbi:hypothetical protein IH992_21905 [Candidatus Poribacteria bacterium]|nr:hypothetical protein [Candidatus Poribacteria bacterium]